MKTPIIFFFRFLLPPLYAAVGFTVFTVAIDSGKLTNAAKSFGAFALYAYIFAGLPSLLFAIAMALIEKKYAADKFLISATLMGGLSGVVIGVIFGIVGVALFASIGLVVGFLVEGTVTLLKRRVLRAT